MSHSRKKYPHPMKHPFAILLPALAAAGILGSGCIAIPMGTETFTTE